MTDGHRATLEERVPRLEESAAAAKLLHTFAEIRMENHLRTDLDQGWAAVAGGAS